MNRRKMLKNTMLGAVAASTGLAYANLESGLIAPKSLSGEIDVDPVDPNYFIPNRFKGKTMIVTGCARGMGMTAVRRAAKEGANIVGVDWLEKEGKAVIDGIVNDGGSAKFVHGDISTNETCREMVQKAVESYGKLDFAINNAGVMDAIHPSEPINYEKQKHLTFSRCHEATDEYWDVVMRVNATGMFKCLREELKQLVAQKQGGAIVNVGSVAGLRGFSGTPSYVASKHAVNGLTKNAAIDYAEYGIRVNSVNMANTSTSMVERAYKLMMAKSKANKDNPGSGISSIKTQSLLQFTDSEHRDSTPEEQVAIMLFLLSKEASYITGANWATDGGFTTF
ncbi:SDR family NAD(P)-dependent oxidoreductase [Aequorivita xiaoshiensis]|uniref:SDR family oxidoreductase n=1 Tax=Aequorivita xiaoshiensis TaxID=2874476 RepID=A0A9X1R1V3_9FLAO|nr:SDR family oxidoreductase [Aequorivita xiaoshiensis]MCG2430322.1 SDR family oxidoreductase [Aequorivita xiaoshiensis]